jgi:hypothetical protein
VTADVYGAWLAAGDRLQPAAEWIADWWPNLAIAALAIAVIAWACRPPRNDYRNRNDRVQAQHITRAEPRPEPAAPGNDNGLLLDAYLTYHGTAGPARLRDAINQHRTGEK